LAICHGCSAARGIYPAHGILGHVGFPAIRTFDSSRTPKRGESLATPRRLAEVDLTAIVAALAAVDNEDPEKPKDYSAQSRV
jgi:hypothetical protein